MSNFLDLEPEEHVDQNSTKSPDLKQLLSQIPIVSAPTRLHPEVSDKLAQVHGFTSREATAPAKVVGGRRQTRGMPVEETRQLSIRMPLSLYSKFVTFADRKRLTYNEAIRTLLDRS